MSQLLRCDAFVRHKLAVDFASLKHTCPRGVYVAPDPVSPFLWTGVLFASRGPYSNAIFRFQIAFSNSFPNTAPVVSFTSDVFHPLVTPLTTYTYTGQDSSGSPETVSAADPARLPPGGVSLRHGFPEWFDGSSRDDGVQAASLRVGEPGTKNSTVQENMQALPDPNSEAEREPKDIVNEVKEVPSATRPISQPRQQPPPHIAEVLHYLRVIFTSEDVLDTIPLESAANNGAWHAWRAFRARQQGGQTSSPVRRGPPTPNESKVTAFRPYQQQPGGARRPGDWNWQGVWEDRVRKNIQNSITEQALYGGGDGDPIGFLKMDRDAVKAITLLEV